MILLIDYNTLKIKRKWNITANLNSEIEAPIVHSPEGFWFNTLALKSDDDWFNKFMKSSEYKRYIRKNKLNNIKNPD